MILKELTQNGFTGKENSQTSLFDYARQWTRVMIDNREERATDDGYLIISLWESYYWVTD